MIDESKMIGHTENGIHHPKKEKPMRDMEQFIRELHADMEEAGRRDPEFGDIDVFLKRTEDLTNAEMKAVFDSFPERETPEFLNLSLP